MTSFGMKMYMEECNTYKKVTALFIANFHQTKAKTKMKLVELYMTQENRKEL